MIFTPILRVFFRGTAVAKGRAKTRKMANGETMAYTPAKTANAEKSFGEIASETMGSREPYGKKTPLSVFIIVIRPKPTSARKSDLLVLTRPDLDNYLKLYLDAMNEIVMIDDSTVAHLHGWKVYGPIPGVFIEVSTIQGAPYTWDELRAIATGG